MTRLPLRLLQARPLMDRAKGARQCNYERQFQSREHVVKAGAAGITDITGNSMAAKVSNAALGTNFNTPSFTGSVQQAGTRCAKCRSW